MARAQDIGDQFPSDSFNHNPQDVSEGRSQFDYGTRPNVDEAFEATALAEQAATTYEVVQYEIVSQLDDVLVANEITTDASGNEVASTTSSFIAKPEELRASFFDTDGATNDEGEIVEALSEGTRQVTVNTRVRVEEIYPPYATGRRIFAAKTTLSGVSGVKLIDTNADGRYWRLVENEEKYFQITDIDKDTYVCQEWDFDTGAQKLDASGALLPSVIVAKPHILRGSVWNGNTIGGIAYAVSGGSTEADPFTTRIAATDETQDIIPEWLTSVTIIEAIFKKGGTGAFRNSVEAMWQDKNSGAHAFTERFA